MYISQVSVKNSHSSHLSIDLEDSVLLRLMLASCEVGSGRDIYLLF